MSATDGDAAFVDTNVLVYAFANNDSARSPVAQRLIRELLMEGTLRTSSQVLQELFVTLTRKVKPPLSASQALRYLDGMAEWPVALIDYSAARAAIELSMKHAFRFWDALIVITASRIGAKRLYTEDLQHGRKILGIEIINPFGSL